MKYKVGDSVIITGCGKSALPYEFMNRNATIMKLPENIGDAYQILIQNDEHGCWYAHEINLKYFKMNRNGANS